MYFLPVFFLLIFKVFLEIISLVYTPKSTMLTTGNIIRMAILVSFAIIENGIINRNESSP